MLLGKEQIAELSRKTGVSTIGGFIVYDGPLRTANEVITSFAKENRIAISDCNKNDEIKEESKFQKQANIKTQKRPKPYTKTIHNKQQKEQLPHEERKVQSRTPSNPPYAPQMMPNYSIYPQFDPQFCSMYAGGFNYYPYITYPYSYTPYAYPVYPPYYLPSYFPGSYVI